MTDTTQKAEEIVAAAYAMAEKYNGGPAKNTLDRVCINAFTVGVLKSEIALLLEGQHSAQR